VAPSSPAQKNGALPQGRLACERLLGRRGAYAVIGTEEPMKMGAPPNAERGRCADLRPANEQGAGSRPLLRFKTSRPQNCSARLLRLWNLLALDRRGLSEAIERLLSAIWERRARHGRGAFEVLQVHCKAWPE